MEHASALNRLLAKAKQKNQTKIVSLIISKQSCDIPAKSIAAADVSLLTDVQTHPDTRNRSHSKLAKRNFC